MSSQVWAATECNSERGARRSRWAKQKVAELEAKLGDLQREVELRQNEDHALEKVRRLYPCLSSQVWKGI